MSRAFEARLLRIERTLKEAALGVRYIVSDTLPSEEPGGEDLIPEGCSIHRRGAAIYVVSDELPTEEEWERERCTEF